MELFSKHVSGCSSYCEDHMPVLFYVMLGNQQASNDVLALAVAEMKHWKFCNTQSGLPMGSVTAAALAMNELLLGKTRRHLVFHYFL